MHLILSAPVFPPAADELNRHTSASIFVILTPLGAGAASCHFAADRALQRSLFSIWPGVSVIRVGPWAPTVRFTQDELFSGGCSQHGGLRSPEICSSPFSVQRIVTLLFCSATQGQSTPTKQHVNIVGQKNVLELGRKWSLNISPFFFSSANKSDCHKKLWNLYINEKKVVKAVSKNGNIVCHTQFCWDPQHIDRFHRSLLKHTCSTTTHVVKTAAHSCVENKSCLWNKVNKAENIYESTHTHTKKPS